MATPVCTPKALTPAQLQAAVRRSLEINPANAVDARTVERTPVGRRGGQRRLALVVGSRWPETGQTLSVQFLDSPSQGLRKKILEHMNAWNEFCNIRFVETAGKGQVRIARLDGPPAMAGYWSYVGTQILGIDEDQPTMNLEGFTLRTSDDEFRRVVRHEAGHTIGFDHEHMRKELVSRIDRKKAIAYFDETQGWTEQETIDQVLTPLSKKSILGTTEADPLSIMCYEIPGEITKDGKPIVGGVDINGIDAAFAAKMYPKPSAARDATGQPVASFSEPVDAAALLAAAAKDSAMLVLPGSVTIEPAAAEPGATVVTVPAADASVPTVTFLGQPEADTLHIVVMDEFDHESGEAKNPESPHFARVFASYGGARVTSPMRLKAEKGETPTSFGRIIGVHQRIKKYTNQQQGSLPNDEEMIRFGTDLFEALFQGDVRRLYDEARSRQQNRKLDIVLTSMIPWIAEKPWEFAYDASRESYLATEETHFVRNVLTAVPANWIPPQPGPLRILVAAAQPVGLGKLDVEQEKEVIRRGFQPLEEAGLVKVEVLARTTPTEFRRALSAGGFTVVHFIGHSMFDEEAGEGVLFFEDDRGGQVRLRERSVREFFSKKGISLVFLNSCESGTGGRGRNKFNRGVAQGLVSHGLPAVVANQYSVLDTSATSFSQHFYWSLANGMSIGQAACEARIAVNCSLQGEIIDWAVPVVYVRDPNMTLCVKPERPVPASVAVRSSARRRVRNKVVRIAVWDIDNVLPRLGETLEKMNDAQGIFGFELAALSVPLDAWNREDLAEDGTPYLRADKLAERLKSMTVELRVDLLACITSHWLCDDEWRNLYGWWPDEQKPPVVVFSTAGFEMAAEGPETDRAIANMSVSALTGFYAQDGSHDRGPKDCPLYFNQERDFTHLIGQQAFDAPCRARLKKDLPAGYLAALEELLKPLH